MLPVLALAVARLLSESVGLLLLRSLVVGDREQFQIA
jgi:hypothetical protein